MIKTARKYFFCSLQIKQTFKGLWPTLPITYRKSIQYFLRYPGDRQTDKQMDRQTNRQTERGKRAEYKNT